MLENVGNRNRTLAKLLNESDKDMEKIFSSFEKDLLRNYEAALTDIKNLMARLYEKLGSDVSINNAYRFDRLDKLQEQIIAEIKKLTNRNISLAKSGIQEIYSESFYLTGYSLEVAADMKLGFALLNPALVEASLFNKLDRVKWPDRMKANAQLHARQVMDQITQGLIKGSSYQDIAKAVSKKTGMDAYRSLRIIRTEGHRVQSAGRQLGFERLQSIAEREEIEVKKKWVSTLDSRTRDSHKTMDGQNPDQEGYYTFPSGVRTLGPGLSGIPEEDIHCRCTEVLEFTKFPYKQRRDQNNVIPYKTYEEWKNGRINK